jgi:hypothetical protein
VRQWRRQQGAHGAPARERSGVTGSPRAPSSLCELRRASPKPSAQAGPSRGPGWSPGKNGAGAEPR